MVHPFFIADYKMEQSWTSEGFYPARIQTQDSCVLKRFCLGASRWGKRLSSLLWKLTRGRSWIRVCYEEECTLVASPTVTSGK